MENIWYKEHSYSIISNSLYYSTGKSSDWVLREYMWLYSNTKKLSLENSLPCTAKLDVAF